MVDMPVVVSKIFYRIIIGLGRRTIERGHIMRQVLVVDNDSDFCQAICDNMRDSFTEVCCVTSTEEALASYMKQDYHLVVLDIQCADVDVITMLRTMRNAKHTPILVLTVPLTPEGILSLFHAGADTYLEKPLNVDVCIAQANALIKRYIDAEINHEHYKPVVYGTELIISPRYRQVMIHGKFLSLTKKEFDLLHYFASHPEQVFTRAQLYDHIWDGETAIAVDESVKSLIKKLRKKLAAADKNYIQNLRGIGYRFVIQIDFP